MTDFKCYACRLIGVGCFVVLAGAAAYAAPPKEPEPVYFQVPPTKSTLALHSVQIGGDDRPYAEAWTTLGKRLRSRNSPVKVLEEVKKEALAHPNAAICQFRWGYVALLAVSRCLVPTDSLVEPAKAMARFTSPYPYSYAKVLFLIENVHYPTGEPMKRLRGKPNSGSQGSASLLADVGKKLLRVRPDDVVVTNKVALLLSWSRKAAEVREAVTYAQKASAMSKEDPGHLFNIGLIQYNLFTLTKAKADGDACIASFELFLSKAPSGTRYEGLVRAGRSYLQEMVAWRGSLRRSK